MTSFFIRPDPAREHLTPEGCYILESWNAVEDGEASIARARVAGVVQSIANTGTRDLVFYCICTPRFTSDCYEAL